MQKGNSNLVFSKAKVVHRKKKTLPTLELLGVFQAVKFIFKIVQTYKRFKIRSIYIAVDARVVLSWLLTDRVKIKNVFAANRIKYIQAMISDLKTFSLNVYFKYVPTRENPTDLLTRGLTLAAFKEDLDFWLKGPTWLRGDSVKWPASNLECLSSANHNIIIHRGLCISRFPSHKV